MKQSCFCCNCIVEKGKYVTRFIEQTRYIICNDCDKKQFENFLTQKKLHGTGKIK